MSIYVDIHVLQTVPPSCVNRDDTGSPKTAVYGGTVRARVSSQAWKHAMREEFKSMFEKEDLASRTKYVTDMVVGEMLASDPSLDLEKCAKKATAALNEAGLGIKEKAGEKDKAGALFFMSRKQARAIAALAVEDKSDKKQLKEALKKEMSVDIALFGRMAANDPTLNCDAAAQVAHAISTHKVQNEFDYFTAVDDMQTEDNAGAGHLGTVEFNSSTLYRYANVNVTELAANLDREDVSDVVGKYVEAFIRSMPTGKENSFANRTVPDTVYVTVRCDQPVNLCGAFEKPVSSSNGGYAAESEACLVEYAKKIYKKYAAEPAAAYGIGDKISDIAQELSLPELIKAVEKEVSQKINEVK